MVAGKTVSITWDSRDRSGRIIGWVLAPDGTEVNLVMVQAGYAWWYEKNTDGEVLLREAAAGSVGRTDFCGTLGLEEV